MSASREKKERRGQTNTPAETKAEEKKGMSRGLKTFLGIVCAVVVVAVVVFFSMVTSGFFEAHTTAATVGGHKITPAMVNYFYKDAYSQMSSFLSYMIDPQTPLDEQIYDEETGETWADMLVDTGLQNACSTYAIYDEALKNGYTLSAEDEAEIESALSMYDTYAASYGYSNADQFLSAYFGKGCSKKSFTEYSRIITIAGNYSTQISEGFTYDDAAVAAEYAANPNDYEAVDYRVYTFYSSDEDDEEPLTDEELKAKADEMAEQSRNNEPAFLDACINNSDETLKASYEDESFSLRSGVNYSDCHTELADWLFDAERAEGDTTVAACSSGYYVAYFISRSDNGYQLPNVRHILSSVAEDATDEEKQDAFSVVEAAMAEFENGDKTEESFGELAKQYSEDGSASEGGLIENIKPGEMVTEFNDWVFDENRQVGDTDIIETQYGYHGMYFCGYGDIYRDVLIRDALHEADYNAWYSSLSSLYTFEKNDFGMKYITK